MAAAGADVDCMAHDGTTGVFTSTMFGKTNTLATLLEVGASPHLTGGKNATPVQCAIVERQPKCLALLLAAGADPKEAYMEAVSAYVSVTLQERRCEPLHQEAPGMSLCQVLAVAPAFAARSWAWPSAATGNEERGESKRRKTEDGTVERAKANAAPVQVRWIIRRRGSVLKCMLRRVGNGRVHRALGMSRGCGG